VCFHRCCFLTTARPAARREHASEYRTGGLSLSGLGAASPFGKTPVGGFMRSIR
jgi:hypothetical protein